MGFSCTPAHIREQIDQDRGRHEIPLYDRSTGQTHYGLDALFLILGSKWRMLKPLLRRSWFRALLYPLYQLITYNRRQIAGSRPPETGFDCAPDFHLGYRLLYLFLAIGSAILMLLGIASKVYLGGEFLLFKSIWIFALLGFGGFLGSLWGKNRWDMAGNTATALLMGTAVVWLSSLIGQEMVWIGLGLGTLLLLREWKRRLW